VPDVLSAGQQTIYTVNRRDFVMRRIYKICIQPLTLLKALETYDNVHLSSLIVIHDSCEFGHQVNILKLGIVDCKSINLVVIIS